MYATNISMVLDGKAGAVYSDKGSGNCLYAGHFSVSYRAERGKADKVD